MHGGKNANTFMASIATPEPRSDIGYGEFLTEREMVLPPRFQRYPVYLHRRGFRVMRPGLCYDSPLGQNSAAWFSARPSPYSCLSPPYMLRRRRTQGRTQRPMATHATNSF